MDTTSTMTTMTTMNTMDDENMYVITRSGEREELSLDKITNRIKKLINMNNKINHVNAHEIMMHVTKGIANNITTAKIDEYAANQSASLGLSNPYYLQVAIRIAADNHHKKTLNTFTDKINLMYNIKYTDSGMEMISDNFHTFVNKYSEEIESMIDYNKDFLLDFFGFRTFQRLYSFKIDGEPIERPQDGFMRVAIALHFDNVSDPKVLLEKIHKTYNLISSKKYTQASPMYFNAGTNHPQYASCFLLGNEDSLEGINLTGFDMAVISKWGGGIGCHINSWRSKNTLIRGTNGKSNGIVPFLKMYNSTMQAFNQGGKRLGSCAVYMMPHHPDIVDFVKLKRNDGEENTRARDLFYAVWIPDIFMERVKSNGDWSLFDPDQTTDLSNYYDGHNGSDKMYTKKYLELEDAGVASKTMKARDLWAEIYRTNLLKGMPYVCFSDNANRQSNQKNLGVIKSSNLCAEIYEYSDYDETAVCNLCSINLESCVIDLGIENADVDTTDTTDTTTDTTDTNVNNTDTIVDHEFPNNPAFDFNQLKQTTKVAVENLNNIIDRTFYPTDKTKRSNIRHRPIGIGVQGQVNAYIKMRYPFDSDKAATLNKQIYETMMYAAYTRSTEMSKEKYKEAVAACKLHGTYEHMKYLPAPDYGEEIVIYNDYRDIPKTIGAYASMLWNGGAPISHGVFCWELAGLTEDKLSGMWDWDSLREHCKIYGMRNSLCIALMPTASTSQLLGNNECFEPFTSNIYKRKTLAGEYIVINKYLIKDLYELGIWSDDVKGYLMELEGSIQQIDGIPDYLKALYKTAWEIDQSVLIQQSIDRQPFVDQGQSLNLYIEKLTLKEFTKLMFQAWKGNLKTGKYYLHTRPAAMAQKFTIDPNKKSSNVNVVGELLRDSSVKSQRFLEPLVEVCDLCSA